MLSFRAVQLVLGVDGYLFPGGSEVNRLNFNPSNVVYIAVYNSPS